MNRDRTTSEFILNRQSYRRATVLADGANSGLGEGPASAAGRLAAGRIRVVIAPGFGPEFEGACVLFGLPAVVLAPAVVNELGEWVDLNPGLEITVDLETQQIERVDREPISLDMHPRLRNNLLFGLSELDETLEHRARISAFRQADRIRRPWLYNWREPSAVETLPLDSFDDEGNDPEA